MSRIYEAIRRVADERDVTLPANGETTLLADRLEPIVACSSAAVAPCVSAPPMDEITAAVPIFTPAHQGTNATTVRPPTPSVEHSPSRGFRTLLVKPQADKRILFRTDLDDFAAEQFRMLRRRLTEAFTRGAVLMVTSPAPKDGKTLTSVNLCACLAERGEPALLLELDVRQPAIDKILGCSRSGQGIEDALAGTSDLSATIQHIEPLAFWASLVTRTPSDASQLISAANVGRLISSARKMFRWVIIDAPPALPAADVSEIAPSVDGTLLVLRARSTPRELASRAATLLGAHLHAVILNDAPIETNPYYGYRSTYSTSDKPRHHIETPVA